MNNGLQKQTLQKQRTTLRMHNTNNNNIMVTITIRNVTVHNDYNEQCI